MNYRKITQNIAGNLTFNEAYTFFCLASKSDYDTMVSFVKQETLSNIAEVSITTVQNHLYKCKEKGLIKIFTDYETGSKGLFKTNKYQLENIHYTLIDTKLINESCSSKMKGFLILLKTQALNGTNSVQYNQSQLAEILGVHKSTISRYIKDAEKLGYLKKTKNGIKITRDDIFYITSESTFAYMKRWYPECLTDEDYVTKRVN